MNKIELNIIALSNSESNKGNYALILEEHKGTRRLPIIIGPFEAQAIAISLEKLDTPRPLTHDLFTNTLDSLRVELTYVLISDLVDGIFHATLYCTKSDNISIRIDSRPSDAIALAARVNCPIFATEEVMEQASFEPESLQKTLPKKSKNLSEHSLEELQEMLKQVLANEDYESASKIQQAIEEKE